MKLILKVLLFISTIALTIAWSFEEYSDFDAAETSEENGSAPVDDEFLNIMASILNVRIDKIDVDIVGQIPPPELQTTTMKMTPEMMEEVDRIRAYSNNNHKFEDDLTNPRLMEQTN